MGFPITPLLIRSCVLIGLSCLLPTVASAQNVTLVKNWKRTPTAKYIDCWGYRSPDGREFAIVAEEQGIWIVETTDPTNIREIAHFTAPQSIWRDFETYGQYIYAISENHRGIRIIDMTNPSAPKDLGLKLTRYIPSAHNAAIDPDTGLLYICGTVPNGALVFDAKASPTDPVPTAWGGTGYIHDACIRRGTAYLSVSYDNRLRITDVTDIQNFKTIVEFKTPGVFTHNSWVTEDDQLLIATDEFSGTSTPPHTTFWNISNPASPVKVGQYIVPGHTVHYAFTMGRTAYLSHYGDGFHMVDFSNPAAPTMLARYDTSTQRGIRGCWGVYPFTDSGLIYCSDMDNGLYVLQVDCGHLNRYGAPTKGSNGLVPRATLLGAAPRVATRDLKFKFENMLPNARFALIMGVSPTTIPLLGVQVHVNLTGARMFWLQADAQGELILPTPIADNANLAGSKVYFQIAAEDPGNPGGFSASRGMWTGVCAK